MEEVCNIVGTAFQKNMGSILSSFTNWLDDTGKII